jgi:hypothetical protein
MEAHNLRREWDFYQFGAEPKSLSGPQVEPPGRKATIISAFFLDAPIRGSPRTRALHLRFCFEVNERFR